ncbi:hypothetical protein B0T21DRAFT_420413 [Apiosordaria backusii]|uniref:Uncharacterized protein n=1 Tax=Apiosordaria backusii TaxID=314023 RepID=A0AA40EZW5_9PEZI|nr:hypothetical protein B0T21DRAFT_420413 [Apiosordaria backusii]
MRWATAALVILTAQFAVHAEKAPLDGYEVVDLEWILPIDPNNPSGENMTVTGTIEDAIAQMDAKYPGWNQTFTSSLPPPDAASLEPSTESDGFKCGDPWYQCSQAAIVSGAQYLQGVKSDPPKMGTGPSNCGRVSCSWASSIWMCNNSTLGEAQSTWKEIGDSALFLAYKCGYPDRLNMWVTRGQEFFKGNWSVVVTWADC